MRQRTERSTADLCYLDASKVKTPAGVLSEFDLLTPEAERLGCIRGVVIDAHARRVRYLDVEAAARQAPGRYLLDAGQLAVVDGAGKSLRLREPVTDAEMSTIDPRDIRPFTDDDLLAAMFSAQAA